MTEEETNWSKCKSVTTDGVTAMMVSTINDVVRKVQNVAPNCAPIHCVIHSEVLVAKRVKEAKYGKEKNDFELLLDNVK